MPGEDVEVGIGVEHRDPGINGDGSDQAIEHPPRNFSLEPTQTVKSCAPVVVGRTGGDQSSRGQQPAEAVDCDSDPNLALNLGMGEETAAALRPLLDQSGPIRRLPEDMAASRLIERYGYPGPDGVRVLLAARIEKPGAG